MLLMRLMSSTLTDASPETREDMIKYSRQTNSFCITPHTTPLPLLFYYLQYSTGTLNMPPGVFLFANGIARHQSAKISTQERLAPPMSANPHHS
jgi:hypothetical protein